MDKNEFLSLDTQEAMVYASFKLEVKEWTIDQYRKAVSEYSKHKKDQQELFKQDKYNRIYNQPN